MTKLHAPRAEEMIVGQMAAEKEKLEVFVNKIFSQAVDDGLTMKQMLVCISSLHTAVLDAPANVTLKKLKEMK